MNDEPEMIAESSGAAPEVSILFKQFLESIHPSVVMKVSGLWREVRAYGGQRSVHMLTPDLRLHCPDCEGERTFRCNENSPSLTIGAANGRFVSYLCSDCRKARKFFSLWIIPSKDAGRGRVYKYGEKPPFGVPVPNKLLRLFGSDGKTFLKGRQCENQGLGIGAFAYYRRVVESRKKELFDEIILVCETLKASSELIDQLREAKDEVSFTKAVDHIANSDAIRPGIPI